MSKVKSFIISYLSMSAMATVSDKRNVFANWVVRCWHISGSFHYKFQDLGLRLVGIGQMQSAGKLNLCKIKLQRRRRLQTRWEQTTLTWSDVKNKHSPRGKDEERNKKHNNNKKYNKNKTDLNNGEQNKKQITAIAKATTTKLPQQRPNGSRDCRSFYSVILLVAHPPRRPKQRAKQCKAQKSVAYFQQQR